VTDLLRDAPSLSLALALGYEVGRGPSASGVGTASALATELARRGELESALAGIPEAATSIRVFLQMDRARARFGGTSL
jgi:hypothetical protein